MIKVGIVGVAAVGDRLAALDGKVKSALRKTITEITLEVEARVKQKSDRRIA
jgi:hypothetical protein